MTATRPGGRSAKVRDAVHRAAIELLAAGELDAAIPRIAEQAGVHPTSVYRRWGTRENLLMDAAATRMHERSPVPDTGSLRGDLAAWATGVERAMTEPEGHVLLRALVATVSNVGRPSEHLRLRGADLQKLLDRAAARGERVPALDDILDHVLAPLYVRALFGMPLPAGMGTTLVEQLVSPSE
ncbi:TetR/AcrR family transcriptional regulator [Actinophytocola oryzae]|uniref:TetR family transcriptional regulator n=1 Tax=Actinophytocola oryzae TaxID=502181 RepID=A0A4R7W0T4_9PSEU|nr:TetR/AcrR family transcriptional regulator [Actinophytocola oryzae]TDV55137.1 TetR family transcriptional regulator [Actinophytocola oryzae]